MFQRVKFIYIIFLIIAFTSSCKLFNGEEGEPAYLSIDNINLDNTNVGVSNSNNIVDVWVGTPEDELGVFTFPAEVPVLEYGEVPITFDAGIYVDGQTAKREKYFFYETYVDTINLVSGNTIDIVPQFSYLDNVVFSDLGSDNFESSIRHYVADNDLSITYEEDNENSYESTSAYLYNPNNEEKELRIMSKKEFLIDNEKELAPVFLEFDYRTSIETTVGLDITRNGITQTYPHATLFSTDGEWTHLYLDLTLKVNLTSSEAEYKLFFQGTSNIKDQYIGIDNVRLVYLNK